MTKEILQELDPLLPIDFFNFSFTVKKCKKPSEPLTKAYLLPSTGPFLAEEIFADVFMGWHEEGISIRAEVHKPLEKSVFPKFEEGDSMELFFDTRDMKTSGVVTRFCHHFLLLPEEVEGITCQEITRLRADDTRPLCPPEELRLQTRKTKKEYVLDLFIPASCLHGYDPSAFPRLGFTYRINRPENSTARKEATPQHFTVSSKLYNIAQHPSFWASLKLIP